MSCDAPAEIKPTAIEFAGEVVGNDAEKLVVSILSGGITNQLYRVKNQESGKSVVVRVFGKETERIISRNAELFWQTIFIKTFGRKENMLVYEFLDGYKDMDFHEMVPYAEAIAKSVAEFHLKATGACLGTLPYATQQNFCNEFLTKWVDLALSEETFSRLSKEKQEQFNKMTLKTVIREEAKELLATLDQHKHEMPEGPSHNDLLSPNIMLKRDSNSTENPPAPVMPLDIKLIDFEYARRNYLYYDIANHFNEYTGLDCEWDKYFPTEDQQRTFIKAYVLRLREESGHMANDEELNAEVERVRKLVMFLTGLSNICWAVWAIIQAAFSEIDFDYLSYSEMRWQRYVDTKEQFKL